MAPPLVDFHSKMAVMIRREIEKIERGRSESGLVQSTADVFSQGQIDGLRRALAYVDPSPHT